MKCRFQRLAPVALGLAWLLAGCAHQTDWKSRVGSYTYDDAVRELGPPDKKETLSDNTLVAEWVTITGWNHTTRHPIRPVLRSEVYWTFETTTESTPDTIVRLTFSPERKLTDFKSFYR